MIKHRTKEETRYRAKERESQREMGKQRDNEIEIESQQTKNKKCVGSLSLARCVKHK